MQTLAFLSPKRRFVTTGFMVFGALFAYHLFPFDAKLNETAQAIISGALFFLVLPMLYVKLILKEPIHSLGFRRSERPYGAILIPLATISALSILYLLIRFYQIESVYYIPTLAKESFLWFLLYEVLLVGAVAFLYEVFFRGFVQLLWLRKLGLSAAFLQAGLFASAVFLLSAVTWQELPMLLAVFFAGAVAFYTRSIWYSWATSWLILFLADVYLLTII